MSWRPTYSELYSYHMSLQVVTLDELLAAVCALVGLIEGVNSPESQTFVMQNSYLNVKDLVNLHMQLILFLILERSRAHAALEWILIDVSLYMSFQVVRLRKLLLANLQEKIKELQLSISFRNLDSRHSHHIYRA